MKTYELNNQAILNRANVQVETKTVYDFYLEVKNEHIVPITNEDECIVGFQVVKEKPSQMKVCKVIGNTLTVGDTEEDRQVDEVNLLKFFQEYPKALVQRWFEQAMLIVKSGYEPDDLISDGATLYMIMADKKQVWSLDGTVIIDLSEDKDLENAPKNLIIKLLRSSYNAAF